MRRLRTSRLAATVTAAALTTAAALFVTATPAQADTGDCILFLGYNGFEGVQYDAGCILGGTTTLPNRQGLCFTELTTVATPAVPDELADEACDQAVL